MKRFDIGLNDLVWKWLEKFDKKDEGSSLTGYGIWMKWFVKING